MDPPESIPLIALNSPGDNQSSRGRNPSAGSNGPLPLHNKGLYKDDTFKSQVQQIVNDTPDAVEHKDGTNRNVIHFLIENANDCPDAADVLSFFIRSNVRLDEAVGNDLYPIHLAILYNKSRMFKCLTDAETSVKQTELQDEKGDTPLHYAAGLPNDKNFAVNCITFLLEKEEDISLAIGRINKAGWTALHYAVHTCNVDTFQALLPVYVEETGVPNKRVPILNFICKQDCTDPIRQTMLTKLLDRLHKSKNTSAFNHCWNYYTPLKQAVRSKNVFAVEALVSKPYVSLIDEDESHRSPIFYAAMAGFSYDGDKCLHALLSREPNVGTTKPGYDLESLFIKLDKNQKTVFDYARQNCHPDAIKILLGTLHPHGSNFQAKMQEKRSNLKKYATVPIFMHYLMENSFSLKGGGRRGNLIWRPSSVTCNYDPEKYIQETKRIRATMNSWNTEQQKMVMLHPAMQLFVHLKYAKLRFITFILLVIQTLWITSLGFFVSFAHDDKHADRNAVWYSFFLAYIACSSVYEIYEMWQHGLPRYVTNFTNWGQLVRNGFLLGADYCLYQGMNEPGMSYTALGVILAGALSMRYLRNLHSEIGNTVDMLRQVLIKVATVFFCNIVYIASFTVAVGLWFSSNNENSKSEIVTRLDNRTNTINTKVLPELQYNDTSGVFPFQEIIMMMTGSIDTEKVNDALPSIGQVGVLNFLIFLTVMVVLIFAIYNQLTGVAIAKVSEMTEKAEVHRVMSKIEYIFLVETLIFILYQFLCMLSKICRCSHGSNRLAKYFRRLDLASSSQGEYSECVEIRAELNPVNHSMKDKFLWNLGNIPDIGTISGDDFRRMYRRAEKADNIRSKQTGLPSEDKRYKVAFIRVTTRDVILKSKKKKCHECMRLGKE